MSKLGDYAIAILQGGLPAALDQGKSAGLSTGDTRPEQTPPSPKVEDRDTSNPIKPVNVLDFMTPTTWIIAGVGTVVVVAVMFVAFRALGKK